MREVVAEFEKPVMLYSIGKDSSVMLHLALKAFYPGAAAVSAAARRHDLEVPRDVSRFRDQMAQRARAASCSSTRNPEGIARGHQPVRPRLGAAHRRDEDRRRCKQALDKHGFDAAFGGARRDEEKSPRQGAHLLVPHARSTAGTRRTSGPSSGSLYNARMRQGREHPRLPAVELDRARRLAVHPPARTSRSCRSTSPSRAPGGASATAR